MKKIFVTAGQIQGQTIILDKEESTHIMKALRHHIGDQILVSDQEMEYQTRIESFTDGLARLVIIDAQKTDDMGLHIRLVQGICKGEKMDWIIQKAVELGVAEIIPLMSRRSVVRLDQDKARKKVERWQKVALAAAKQSGSSRLPEISDVIGVTQMAGRMPEDALHLLFWEEAEPGTLKKVVQGQTCSEITLFIGPEGGFDPEEVRMFEEAGAKTVSLGKQILRTETAAMAAISCIMYEYNKLG